MTRPRGGAGRAAPRAAAARRCRVAERSAAPRIAAGSRATWSPRRRCAAPAAGPRRKMAHAAASIKKVREAELDEKEKILERERKKQRKIPRERMERKRKVGRRGPPGSLRGEGAPEPGGDASLPVAPFLPVVLVRRQQVRCPSWWVRWVRGREGEVGTWRSILRVSAAGWSPRASPGSARVGLRSEQTGGLVAPPFPPGGDAVPCEPALGVLVQ